MTEAVPGTPHGRFRRVPVEQTLQTARGWRDRAGIAEVRDISGLDALDCCVFASFRPHSLSATVAYGKGLNALDAEVGALMESIELYFAEPGRAAVPTRRGSARDVVGARQRPDAILDYAPLLNTAIDLDARMLLCEAEDVESGARGEIPAELVFFPAPVEVDTVFGASTNGLASGNCLTEASLQGLFEVIERDIWSFETLRDGSRLVDPASLPRPVAGICRAIEDRDLRLCVRYVDNAYRLPFFVAFLFDPADPGVRLFNGGWGCHFSREAALVSAVCEAAQGRIAVLHGVREFKRIEDDAARTRFLQSLLSRATRDDARIDYGDTADVAMTADLETRLERLIAHLRLVIDSPVLRVRFTEPGEPLQVVRIVVPTAEHFRFSARRAGARLRNMLESEPGDR